MSVLTVLTVLVLICAYIYCVRVAARRTAAARLRNGIDQDQAAFGQHLAHGQQQDAANARQLFAPGGRAGADVASYAVPVPSQEATPSPRRVGPQPCGPGRSRNPHAPCWVCGQPRTPGHRH